MEPQLHCSTIANLLPLVAAVENRSFVKPLYGLWTSTYTDGSSGWVDWCRSEAFGDVDAAQWYVLYPQPTARIYTIDTHADLVRLLERYADRFYHLVYPDFERISQDYDAIHLTNAGQWATRHSEPGLYGWDCESTLWFRWSFYRMERVTSGVLLPV